MRALAPIAFAVGLIVPGSHAAEAPRYIKGLYSWLRAKLGLISQKSKLATAIRYAGDLTTLAG